MLAPAVTCSVAAAGLTLLALTGTGTRVAGLPRPLPGPGIGRPGTPVAYRLPVDGPLRVVTPFRAPAGPYAPGHRGVDLAIEPSGRVRAAAAGVVAFAGPVAGRGVVVVTHPDGLTTEYEPVAPAVRAGQRVTASTTLGRVSGRHGGCAPDRCLHWAVRRGGTYLDPLAVLRPLGTVRLLPWNSAAGGPEP